jgi:hypothetical protein
MGYLRCVRAHPRSWIIHFIPVNERIRDSSVKLNASIDFIFLQISPFHFWAFLDFRRFVRKIFSVMGLRQTPTLSCFPCHASAATREAEPSHPTVQSVARFREASLLCSLSRFVGHPWRRIFYDREGYFSFLSKVALCEEKLRTQSLQQY